MREIKTVDAVGHVICHDISRIIAGGSRDVAFHKGHVVREEDIEVLHKIGKMHLFVWEDDENLVHENDAAAIVYKVLGGSNMKADEPDEGKIVVRAGADGVLRVDKDRLFALNMTGEAAVSTRHDFSAVRNGDKIAATRIIPLFIQKENLERVQALADEKPIVDLLPYRHKEIAIVTTGSEVYQGLIKDAISPVLRRKLAEFPFTEIGQCVVPDDSVSATNAISEYKNAGAKIIFVTGGMSVDPDDRTPLAIKNTGADIVLYGTPVTPGAMFLVAYLDDTVVFGVPGGVLHSPRTILDILLPRAFADIPITKEDVRALGLGGICLNCDVCIFPVCGFGAV